MERIRFSCLIGFGIVMNVCVAHAGDTFVWNGLEGDSPTVASNWLLGGVPASTLPSAEDTIDIPIDRTLTINSSDSHDLLKGVAVANVDGTLVCTGAIDYNLPVTLSISGSGAIRFVSAYSVILGSSGRDYSGSFLFTNNTVYVNNVTALGSGPVSFYSGATATTGKRINIQASGTYSNTFHLDAENNSYAYRVANNAVVTNTGLMTCHGYITRFETSDGAALTLRGGIVDAVGNTGNARLDGDIILDGGELSLANGLWFGKGNIVLATKLDCPMLMSNAIVTFMGENLLNGQDLQLVYEASPTTGVLDLNGNSQTGRAFLQINPGGNICKTLLTSVAKDATLTFSDADTYVNSLFRIGGRLSLDIKIPWHQYQHKFYLGNPDGLPSDTKGTIVCRGGTGRGYMEFLSSANFKQLSAISAIGGQVQIDDGAMFGQKLDLSFDTDSVNKSGALKLLQNMSVRSVKVNGKFLPAGDYTYASGGSGFMTADSTGILTVRQCSDKLGFEVIVW